MLVPHWEGNSTPTIKINKVGNAHPTLEIDYAKLRKSQDCDRP